MLFLWEKRTGVRKPVFGTPIENREEGKEYPLSGFSRVSFTSDEKGLLLTTTMFDDSGSLAYLELDRPDKLEQVKISGLKHTGSGELEEIRRGAAEKASRFNLKYNIDGCTWIYEGVFGSEGNGKKYLKVGKVIVGKSPLSQGVVLGFEPGVNSSKKKRVSKKAEYCFSFSTATEPSQLYICETQKTSRNLFSALSSERVLGIPHNILSTGEDASFKSFDGLRINSRIYLPAKSLGFKEPFPLVLYVHGGRQGQERPDFTWFSMPLIQLLTLRGMAVFVPNVRGSTGYGQRFMKMVDHDWGGNYRLDTRRRAKGDRKRPAN